MGRRWLALLALWVAVSSLWLPARAETTMCGETRDLEMDAYRGRLSEQTRACLESNLETAEPQARAAHSFVLIVDAYVSRDTARYGQLMERHLSKFHTTDAEVAYLYANWLWREQGPSDAVVRWAKVAMDGRRRWLSNRANYDRMVRALYDMLVTVSMERAVAVEKELGATRTPEQNARLEAYRRQARYWLIIAAPCLHKGECGPYFEVEIEGWAPCDDLVAMDMHAKRGQLVEEQWSCLQSSYRKPAAPKRRILDVLASQADTIADGKKWEELLAWQWNVEGVEDPELAYRYASFLSRTQGVAADTAEVMKWSAVALEAKERFTGRSGKAAMTQLHELRVSTAQRMFDRAKALVPADPEAVQFAEEELKKEEAALAAHCATATDCGP